MVIMQEILKKTLDKNFSLVRIKQKIKQNKNLIIVISVMQIIAISFMFVARCIIEMFDDSEMQADMFSGVINVVGILCFVLALLFEAWSAVKIFDYLTNKKQIDVEMSLPLSARQRFCSDFISGLIINILPYIASGVVVFVLYLFFMNKIDCTIQKLSASVCVVMFIGIFVYVTTVFIAVCCGSKMEILVDTVLVNVILPYLGGVLIGFPSIHFPSFLKGYFFLHMVQNAGEIYADIHVVLRWTFFSLLLCFLMFFISFRLYKKRKSEDVGKTYIFSFVYYIIMFILVEFLIKFFEESKVIYIFGAIFLIVDIIRKRYETDILIFLKIFKSVCAYVVIVMIALFLEPILSLIFSLSLKYEERTETSIPKSFNVVKAIIWEHPTYDPNERELDNALVFDDRDVIEKFLEIHNKIGVEKCIGEGADHDVHSIEPIDNIREKQEAYWLDVCRLRHFEYQKTIVYITRTGKVKAYTYNNNASELLDYSYIIDNIFYRDIDRAEAYYKIIF